METGKQKGNERAVAILTPYLFENAQNFFREGESLNNMLFQLFECGYDPRRNFGRLSQLKTGKSSICLVYPETREGMCNSDNLAEIISNPKVIFSIAGSTEGFENFIRSLKGSGSLIGRYSIFYGGESRYTGRSSSESGYSFDIPKNPDAVLKMLQNDELLDALQQRNKSKIETALNDLNTELEKPVLTTSYLDEALKYR